MRQGAGRIEPDRLPERLRRLRHAPRRGERDAQVVVRLGVLRPGFHREPELLGRLRVAVRGQQRVAVVVAQVAGVRIGGDGLPVVIERAFRLAAGRERASEVAVRLRVPVVQGQGGLVECDGPRQVAPLAVRGGQVVVGRGPHVILRQQRPVGAGGADEDERRDEGRAGEGGGAPRRPRQVVAARRREQHEEGRQGVAVAREDVERDDARRVEAEHQVQRQEAPAPGPGERDPGRGQGHEHSEVGEPPGRGQREGVLLVRVLAFGVDHLDGVERQRRLADEQAQPAPR